MKTGMSYRRLGWFLGAAATVGLVAQFWLMAAETQKPRIFVAEGISEAQYLALSGGSVKAMDFSEKQGPSFSVGYTVAPKVAKVDMPRTVNIYVRGVTTDQATVTMSLEDAMLIENNATNWQLQANEVNVIKVVATPLKAANSLPLIHVTISDGKATVTKTIPLLTAGRNQLAGQNLPQGQHPLGQFTKDHAGRSIVVMQATDPDQSTLSAASAKFSRWFGLSK